MASLYSYKTKTPKSRRKTLQLNKEDELLFREKPKKIINNINKIENHLISMYNDTCFIENFMYNLKDTKDVKNIFDNVNYEINNLISDVKIKKNKQIKCVQVSEGLINNLTEEEWKEKCEELKEFLNSKNRNGIYIQDCAISKNGSGMCTVRGLQSHNDISVKKNNILERSINKTFDLVECTNPDIQHALTRWNCANMFKFYVKNTTVNNKGEQQFLKFLNIPF